MTNSKWLLVGLICGFLGSTVSCGEPKNCDASSCSNGCCNSDGECVTNTTASQCGSNGRQCTQCGFAQVCQLGQCYGGSSTGGSGGTTGGGAGSTGGGTGSNPTCTQLGAAESAFYAGNTECTATFDGGTVTFNASSSGVAGCNVAMSNAACSTADRQKMTTFVSCLQAAPHCTAGNENTAVSSFQACAEALFGPSGLSSACAAAVSNPPTGGGTAVTGGGSGTTGGGSGVTGGGSATTGGGSGVTGGGSATTGGGSGVTGGGSATTGGGSGVTGGGSATTGGGSGSSTCSDVVSFQAAFFVGRSSCPGGSSGTLLPIANLSNICNNICTTNDQSLLSSLGSCASSVPCTSGNETSAVNQYNACASDVVFSLTTNCRDAILASQTGGGTGSTGGGTGSTGGGTGSTGGGTGSTGGGTGSCTEISLGTASQGSGTNVYTGTVSPNIGTSTADTYQLEFYADTAGTYNLSQAPNDNYATCNQCVRVIQDGTGTAKQFYQSAGSLTVSGTPTDGTMSTLLSNVTLVEVTIAPSPSFTSTPVPGGACLHITSASLSAP